MQIQFWILKPSPNFLINIREAENNRTAAAALAYLFTGLHFLHQNRRMESIANSKKNYYVNKKAKMRQQSPTLAWLIIQIQIKIEVVPSFSITSYCSTIIQSIHIQVLAFRYYLVIKIIMIYFSCKKGKSVGRIMTDRSNWWKILFPQKEIL